MLLITGHNNPKFMIVMSTISLLFPFIWLRSQLLFSTLLLLGRIKIFMSERAMNMLAFYYFSMKN